MSPMQMFNILHVWWRILKRAAIIMPNRFCSGCSSLEIKYFSDEFKATLEHVPPFHLLLMEDKVLYSTIARFSQSSYAQKEI